MPDFKTRFTSPVGKGVLGIATLLVVTAVVLRFTVFTPKPTEAPPEPIQLTPIFKSTPQDIISFEVKGRGEHVSLTKTAQGWVFLSLENARVNPQAVQIFLNTLCEWTPTRRLEKPSLTEMRDPFDFTENATVYTVVRSDGKKTQVTTGNYDFNVGLYATTGEYEIYVMDKKTALESKGLMYFLRDHKVFPEPLSGIIRINFRNQGKVTTLSKTAPKQQRRRLGAKLTLPAAGNTREAEARPGPWQIVYPRKFPANQQVVKELLTVIRQWEAKAFVLETVGTRMDMSRYGLVHPVGELTLHTQNNRYPVYLTFGSPPDKEKKIYLKISQQSQIVEIKTDRFLILEELFSHVTSRQLANFLSQVAGIEILTDKWRVTIARDEDLWKAELQERLGGKRLPSVPLASEPRQVRFFKGEILVEIFKQAEYIDCLTVKNPWLQKFQSAKNVMKVIFNQANGKAIDIFTVREHQGMKEMIFLHCQQDNEVYLAARSFYTAILKEIQYQLTRDKSLGTVPE